MTSRAPAHAWLVRTTVGTEAQARKLARALVGPRLAACVHLHPIQSFYTWKGEAKEEKEWVVEARVAGFRRRRRVQKAMVKGHPYEVPMVELVGSFVNRPYHRWMRNG